MYILLIFQNWWLPLLVPVDPARMVGNVYLHQAQMEAAQVQVEVDLDQVGQDLVLTMITHVSVLMDTLAIDVKQVCKLSYIDEHFMANFNHDKLSCALSQKGFCSVLVTAFPHQY